MGPRDISPPADFLSNFNPRKAKGSGMATAFNNAAPPKAGNNPTAELLGPVSMGNLEEIKALHERGADIRNDNDYALRISADKGRLPIVQWLHENGGDIRADDDYAIRWAAANGHLEVVQWLHAHGANPRANNDFALHQAAQNGHLEVVQWLHTQGADLNGLSRHAMRMAAQNGHLPVVQWLHENGSDVHANNDEVFMVVADKGDLPIVQWIYDLKGKHPRSAEAMLHAARNNQFDVVQYFIEKGTDVRALDSLLPLWKSSEDHAGFLGLYQLGLKKKQDNLVGDAIAEAAREAQNRTPSATRRLLNGFGWRSP